MDAAVDADDSSPSMRTRRRGLHHAHLDGFETHRHLRPHDLNIDSRDASTSASRGHTFSSRSVAGTAPLSVVTAEQGPKIATPVAILIGTTAASARSPPRHAPDGLHCGGGGDRQDLLTCPLPLLTTPRW